jgi:hypothetical protein
MRVGEVTVERCRIKPGWNQHRPLRALVESDLRRICTDPRLRCRSTDKMTLSDPYRAYIVVLFVRRGKRRVGEHPREREKRPADDQFE